MYPGGGPSKTEHGSGVPLQHYEGHNNPIQLMPRFNKTVHSSQPKVSFTKQNMHTILRCNAKYI